jgi:DNA repair exonuclease SbcCD ATPase subunit
MDLDIDVARLRLLKADHSSQRYKLEDDLLKYYPERIKAITERITGCKNDISMYREELAKSVTIQEVITTPTHNAARLNAKNDAEAETNDTAKTASAEIQTFPPMSILGETYTDKEAASKALIEACRSVTEKAPVNIGSYLGFKMSVSFNSFDRTYEMTLKGSISHTLNLSSAAAGNISKINNALSSMPESYERSVTQLENLRIQAKDAEAALKEPFMQEAELAEKETRLIYLNAELDIDGSDGTNELMGETKDEAPRGASFHSEELKPAMKSKPSILDGVRSYNADTKPPNGPGKDKAKEPTM